VQRWNFKARAKEPVGAAPEESGRSSFSGHFCASGDHGVRAVLHVWCYSDGLPLPPSAFARGSSGLSQTLVSNLLVPGSRSTTFTASAEKQKGHASRKRKRQRTFGVPCNVLDCADPSMGSMARAQSHPLLTSCYFHRQRASAPWWRIRHGCMVPPSRVRFPPGKARQGKARQGQASFRPRKESG
jgi:hypothetical protein